MEGDKTYEIQNNDSLTAVQSNRCIFKELIFWDKFFRQVFSFLNSKINKRLHMVSRCLITEIRQ